MNLRTVVFVVALAFIIGLVIGFSAKKRPIITDSPIVRQIRVHDTIVKMQIDTIHVPRDRVRYFTRVDTVRIRDTQVITDSAHCVNFPLLLSDSSVIAVTECSAAGVIPPDLTFNAEYIDKRERIRVISDTRVDTVRLQQRVKRMGFALGPSAGIGIDVNNIRQPVYFLGATLTYGWRF